MPQLLQPSEGTAKVQYKLALPKQRYLNFDPEQVTFVEAALNDSVYGNGVGQHIFQSNDPNFMTALKAAMSNADPVLEFRLGFGTPAHTLWLPWQQHIVVDHYAKFQGIGTSAGHLLIIRSANVLIRMQRSNKVLARKGTIAKIVSAIATENKLASVVEATDGEFLLVQNYLDDTRFIGQRLVSRAINQKGRAGYYFYIRDNILHFHTLDYQASVAQIDYYNAFGGDFEAVDRSQDPELWDDGLAGVKLIVHNPYTGKVREYDSDPKQAVKLADSIYQFSNIVNGSWNVPYHQGTNPLSELTALAQSQYQRARQQTFRTQMTLFKTIGLRHGDILNVIATHVGNKSTDYAGLYYVVAASHTVKKDSVTSVYTLERGENQATRSTITVQAPSGQLVPDVKAPGVKPNIGEVQSSELTKGATSTGLLDPQTGQAR
jgi:hypothetical protein